MGDLQAHDGCVWVCQCCGRHAVDRGALYARGCGTHAVECILSTVVFSSDRNLVLRAVARASIHELEIKAKIVV